MDKNFPTGASTRYTNTTMDIRTLRNSRADITSTVTRLRGIQRRDFFPDANAHTAQDVFDQCDQTVYEFAITVYTYYETPSQAISTMPC